MPAPTFITASTSIETTFTRRISTLSPPSSVIVTVLKPAWGCAGKLRLNYVTICLVGSNGVRSEYGCQQQKRLKSASTKEMGTTRPPTDCKIDCECLYPRPLSHLGYHLPKPPNRNFNWPYSLCKPPGVGRLSPPFLIMSLLVGMFFKAIEGLIPNTGKCKANNSIKI